MQSLFKRPWAGLRALAAVVLMCLLTACQPSDQRPGLWLSGKDTPFPQDWTFTDEFKEIFVEVSTPYFIPHSVTIWCASVDGALYIGARDPDSKKWPGWMDNDPNIRLKVGEHRYTVAAEAIPTETELADVRAAYARKYSLKPPAKGKRPRVKYWAIVPPT